MRWLRYQFLMRRSWLRRARGIRLMTLAQSLFDRSARDMIQAQRLYEPAREVETKKP